MTAFVLHFFGTDTKNWVSADTDIDPIPGSFFFIYVEFLYLSVCWPSHHICVLHTIY